MVRLRNPRALVLQVLCGNRLVTACFMECSFAIKAPQICSSVGIHCQCADGTKQDNLCCWHAVGIGKAPPAPTEPGWVLSADASSVFWS